MEKLEEEIKDMTPKLIKDLGLSLLYIKDNRKRRCGLYECQYCGGNFINRLDRVFKPSSSCGCFKYPKNLKHGLASHKFYNTWSGMIQRCTNSKDINYKYYGARGITVCEEWLDVRNFVAWCDLTHPNIEGYSIDRIDVNGNYEPSNCRWADSTTQNINKGVQKNNKSGYTGVRWDTTQNMWRAQITIHSNCTYLGYYISKEEAVQARDNYIIEHKLPHKLST